MPGRGWIMAAVVVLGLTASAGAGRAAGEVTVEGNRFYRDGAPWVAEGVTLVALVSPEATVGEEADLRRGAGGLRPRHARRGQAVRRRPRALPGQPVRARPEVEGPTTRPTATTCWRGIAATRAAGFNVIVSMQWQGAAGRPDPTGLPSATTRRAWREIAPRVRRGPRRPARGLQRAGDRPQPARGLEDLGGGDAAADRHAAPGGVEERAAGRRRAATRGPSTARGCSTTRSASSATPCIPSSGRTTRPAQQWERKFGDFAETHPVMATAFNAQAGGGYCRPELPEQAADLLDYLDEKQIGLVAWALDMPNLREPDGSYTTLDDLVCGKRSEGGQRRRRRDDPRVLPGELMARRRRSSRSSPRSGTPRRRSPRRSPRSGRRTSPTGSSSSSTTPRPTARASSPGRSPPTTRASGCSSGRRTAARRRRATTRSARRAAGSSPSSTPTTAGTRRSSPARPPSWRRAATRSSSRPTAGSPPTAGRSGWCGRRRGSSRAELLRGNVIGCLTAVYDTRGFGRAEMPPLRRRQDYGLWLRLLRQVPYAHALPEVLADYRVRPGLAVGRQARRRRGRPGRSTARSRGSARPRAGLLPRPQSRPGALKRAG